MKTRIERALAALALGALLVLPGCGLTPGGATNGGHATAAVRPPAELHVLAAASLKRPLEDLAPAFEDAHDVKLVFDFGASGILQRQIEAGAPADVFASASPKQVDTLTGEGLVSAEETETFASNDLVVFVPKGNPKGIHGPEDLGKAERIATGNPDTAPHGTKAKEWLTGLGLWAELQPRFVFAENAAQTLDYVRRGEVDAGVGFGSDARGDGAVEVVYAVPKGAIKAIRYVAAPVKASAEPEEAREFVAYLLSAEAQRAFAADHFLAPPNAK